MMRRRSTYSRRAVPAAGFSLVELMVAIALSSLLLTGVVATLSSSRVAYETTEQLSRVQETGRIALDEMLRNIRGAGFCGCSCQPTYISTALANATTLQWNFLEGAVRGYDAAGSSWTPMLDSSIANAAFGSDVLVVRGPRADAQPAVVTTNMANPQDPLVVTGGNIQAGDVVMAYSCDARSFFQVRGTSHGLAHGMGGNAPGNATASTGYSFRRNAEVLPVETTIYYVSPSQGSTAPNNTVPVGTRSLYRQIADGAVEEIAQGVEQMQLEYGIDADGDGSLDGYSPATATTDWRRVLAVRVALLVRSIEQYGTQTNQRAYVLLSNPPVPAANDRRAREVFTATVSLRNRLRVD